MEKELQLLQANVKWLSEKIDLINTNFCNTIGIIIALLSLTGFCYIKRKVEKTIDRRLETTITDIKPVSLFKVELNRMHGVIGFYERYTAEFDFQKHKIKHESDILNAYISKIYYPMYNTETLKKTLNHQKVEESNKDNEDVSLQYIQRQEMYRNNMNINQKGFKSIYNRFNIRFDFENNLIDVFLPPIKSINLNMNNNDNKAYSKLYCELLIINPKYR